LDLPNRTRYLRSCNGSSCTPMTPSAVLSRSRRTAPHFGPAVAAARDAIAVTNLARQWHDRAAVCQVRQRPRRTFPAAVRERHGATTLTLADCDHANFPSRQHPPVGSAERLRCRYPRAAARGGARGVRQGPQAAVHARWPSYACSANCPQVEVCCLGGGLEDRRVRVGQPDRCRPRGASGFTACAPGGPRQPG